ncbi:DUF4129 domain-containing protein [Chitinophaga polysaccharea]|uniref:DUF4129 domain-containing protein n=1 Tax=Chitinophaga TaxID=79328 RepID=UPI0014559448|nr:MULTISPECIES: DUF4129 domain-containing protein [Chitinophaga]NLR60839.1 DUF4129 domain-containing protein [Chitinophaga polysaccharea]NLU94787.1 DUF4129 domain-containing protein [Chitinophaga sp. Ak27]
MSKHFLIKSCLLFVLCLPLQGKAQYDSTVNSVRAEMPDTVDPSIMSDTAAEQNADELPVYQRRRVAASSVNELKADEWLQYHDSQAAPPKEAPWFIRILEALFHVISAGRYIIMGLLLLGLAYVIFRFMQSNGLSIFRKPAPKGGLPDVADESLQDAAEYEGKIKAAIAVGDTRQAIRWWYLYTLFQLSEKQLLVLLRDKTNNDYLREMRNSTHYKKFAALTLDYEYVWYGGFNVSEANFRSMNQEFRDFNNAIGKSW